MNNYQRSFDRVLTHVEANLDEKPDLETLAAIANLSKFHFHKLMRAHLGETLGNFINRIRLETAVKLLRYSTQPIRQISYKVGYETISAFNKGFKKQFGVNPSSIRKDINQLIMQNEISTASNFQLVESIKHIKDIPVIFQQSTGSIGEEATKKNWESIFIYAQELQVITSETKFYGINWDDPEITTIEKIRYDACISINNEIETDFSIKTISGGKYLCFLYKGEYENLGMVYNQIFRDWIIKKEYSLRDKPVFEQYINNKEITPPEDLLTEIFIPIM